MWNKCMCVMCVCMNDVGIQVVCSKKTLQCQGAKPNLDARWRNP